MKSAGTSQERKTIFDYLEAKGSNQNKYCNLKDLTDESSVENFFIFRFIKDLGYKDNEIKTKKSIEELTVSKGRAKEHYKPDFVIIKTNKPRLVIEAKGTEENLDLWEYQPSGYSFSLNKRYTGSDKPVSHYILTNGLETRLYKWDEIEPLISLDFQDFNDGELKFEKLKETISRESVGKRRAPVITEETMIFLRPEMSEVKKIFRKCHKIIWKSERMAPQPAFFEFVKIMLVKLWEDRRLHQNDITIELIKAKLPIPLDQVKFSVKYLDLMGEQTENPFDNLLFRPLISKFEDSVARRDKKRIFESDEGLNIKPSTIRSVVKELENKDLYGIDEDLNGRLFEAFLTATMRGKELGQFFTPRSIVKLVTRLADIKVSTEHVDLVLDGCCGTGGFLIEALTVMRNQVKQNNSLTSDERETLSRKIANESIFGIDAGKDPQIARIARINMYLHGDGGSRIYMADALDKSVSYPLIDTKEVKIDTEELKQYLVNDKIEFDVVLTNPPFSMDCSKNRPDEAAILKQYDLLKYEYKTNNSGRASLRSSIMFMERYFDLLTPGGKLLTVIDDSVLSTDAYSFGRNYIREHFIIRAIISLSGDAFQRSGARAKTSVVYLTKRKKGETGQPDVFMYESIYIGLDDVPEKTPPSIASEAKRAAEEEMEIILKKYKEFLAGGSKENRAPAERVQGRLDVKSCLPRPDDSLPSWYHNEEYLPLEKVVEIVKNPIKIDDLEETDVISFLMVTYNGYTGVGEERLVSEVTYDELYKVEENFIAVSNIAAILGSTGIVTKESKDALASSEYTILRVINPKFNPYYVWAFLRSPEARAILMSESSGISRQRIDWEILKTLKIPIPNETISHSIHADLEEADKLELKAREKREEIIKIMQMNFELDNDWASRRLIAAKPPK